jgi:hypothetical protein
MASLPSNDEITQFDGRYIGQRKNNTASEVLIGSEAEAAAGQVTVAVASKPVEAGNATNSGKKGSFGIRAENISVMRFKLPHVALL